MDEIERTAEAVARWWRDRYTGRDADKFEASLRASVRERLVGGGVCRLECDYDPAGPLLDAVRDAGDECKGFMFSAKGILPEKHSTQVFPGRIVPKEGYGNWTGAIEIPPDSTND